VYAREAEGVKIMEAWRNVRNFIAVCPRLHAVGQIQSLSKSVPELTRSPLDYEKPAPLVVVNAERETAGPRRHFANEFADLMRTSAVTSLGDALHQSQLQGPSRVLEFSGGRCACGRLSLILSRCSRCAREEAAIAAEVDEDEPADVEVAAIGARVRQTLDPSWLPGPARVVSTAEVVGFAATGRVGRDSSVDVRTAKVGCEPIRLFSEVAGKPYRITFAVADGAALLVQACVEANFEWTTEIKTSDALPVGSVVVQIFAADWLFPAELAVGPMIPLLPSSHLHRHARGSELVDGKQVKLSSWTSAYTPVFAAALGQSWLSALRARFQPNVAYDFEKFSSAFSLAPRVAFQAPTCCNVRGAEPGSAEFTELVEEGRKTEKLAIYEREQFAQDVRDTEPAAGEAAFQINASLRSLLIGDQWSDQVLSVICGTLLNKHIDDDAAPGVQKLASDFCLEERVRQPSGECSWVPVLP
jgi:hypothetical protein